MGINAVVNGVVIDLESQPATLGKLVGAVIGKSECASPVVTSLIVNGQEMCGDDFSADLALPDNAAIEAAVTDYSVLLNQSLADGAAYLGDLKIMVQAVAEEFCSGDVSKEQAAARCQAVAERLLYFVKLTEVFEASDQWSFDEVVCEGRSLTSAAKTLHEVICAAYDAQAADDMVQYADLLEYSLGPELDYWHKAYGQLQQG